MEEDSDTDQSMATLPLTCNRPAGQHFEDHATINNFEKKTAILGLHESMARQIRSVLDKF